MIKCQQCRDKDVELLTWVERARNWLFYKINYTLFADDFNDLTSQKYTQGFSDGRKDGREAERTSFDRYRAIYEIERPKMSEDEIKRELSRLLSPIDWDCIVTVDKQKGLVYIGGEHVEGGRLANLKQEAEALGQFELWKLLTETVKESANKAMFVNGETLVDMQKGRSILYTLSQQKNIVDIFRSYNKK